MRNKYYKLGAKSGEEYAAFIYKEKFYDANWSKVEYGMIKKAQEYIGSLKYHQELMQSGFTLRQEDYFTEGFMDGFDKFIKQNLQGGQ